MIGARQQKDPGNGSFYGRIALVEAELMGTTARQGVVFGRKNN